MSVVHPLKQYLMLVCLFGFLAGCEQPEPGNQPGAVKTDAAKTDGEETKSETPEKTTQKDQSNKDAGNDVKTPAATDVKKAPAQKPEVAAKPLPKIPEKVSLRSVNRESYDEFLKQFQGNVVVVDFWGTWCGPCMQKFPETIAMSKKYADKDVVVVSIALDTRRLKDPNDPASDELESRESLETRINEFLAKQDGAIHNLLDETTLETSLTDGFAAYGIEGALPHFKIYGKDGKVAKFFPLEFGKNFTHTDIEETVEELLSEKE